MAGSNCGLGLEAARSLAKHGAIVTIACRSKGHGKQRPGFVDTSEFTAAFKLSGKPIHFLINNAGMAACPKALTSNGLEMQLRGNHIGYFAPITELRKILKTFWKAQNPSRVVTLSSYGAFLF